MNRDRDGKENQKDSAKHISMELTADGARVTSLSLRGSRLILTIEAELADSQLNTGAEAFVAETPEPPQGVRAPSPSTDTQLIIDSLAENATAPEMEEASAPESERRAPEPSPEQEQSLAVDTSMIDTVGEDDEESDPVPGFASGNAHAGVFTDEEDVMGGLPISSYQATGASEAVMPDNAAPVPPPIPEPVAPPEPPAPAIQAKPSASSLFNREIIAKSISLADDADGEAIGDVPGFAASPAREPQAAPPPAKPISLDTGPEVAADAEESEALAFDPGFAPQVPQEKEPPKAERQTMSVTDSNIEDSFDILGFAPAYQDMPAPSGNPQRDPESPTKPEAGGISLADDDSAWIIHDQPPVAIPPVQQPTQAAPAPEKEKGRDLWAPEPELSLTDAPDLGAWGPPAPKKAEPAPAAPAEPQAPEPSARDSWGAPAPEPTPAAPKSASNWGDDVPRHASDSEASTPRPVTETWDASGLQDDSFPAISEESNAVGGERHGEPQPAISYGVSPEAPRAQEGVKPAREAPPPAVPLPAQDHAHQTPAGPVTGADKKAPEPGSTTVLIRYTCPKCKTQGMQAVDKVGTVVNCSNCGKAMRLVMKK